MAAYGIPEFDIARVLKVDPKTLRKYYQEELELGHTKANAQVAGFLFNSAKNGNVTAQIFWLKTRAQWKEPASQHQHVAAVATFDISTIPDEDLEHLKASFDSFSPRDHEILAALWRRLRLSRPLRFQAPDALGGIIGSSCRRR